MAKVSKTFRIEAELWQRVEAAKGDGETSAGALARLLEAGLNGGQADGSVCGTENRSAAQPTESASQARIADLKAHISDLQATVEALQGQLAVKDGQIDTLSSLAATAQELHKASDVMHALQQPRKGLLASIADRFKQSRAEL